MKTTKIILAIALFASSTLLNAQIKVTNTGKIGIGTSNPSTTNNITIEGDSILLRSKTNNEYGFLFQRCSFDQVVDFSPIAHNSNNWEYNLGMEFPFDFISSYNIYVDYGYINTLSVSTFYNYSDKSLKKNIQTLAFDKDVFSKLNPVSFDISDSLLLTEKQREFGKNPNTTNEYGFIAQEIQELYPQLVSTDTKTGFLKIKPLELIPILVSAIKDQQTQISNLENRLSTLEINGNSSMKKVGSVSIPEETDILTYPVLDQNNPNPFNTSTTIGFYLPNSISQAAIYIYDMNGVQLKCYPVAEKGKGNITIHGSELNAGMYLYALITDGKVIDTKRMILTK